MKLSANRSLVALVILASTVTLSGCPLIDSKKYESEEGEVETTSAESTDRGGDNADAATDQATIKINVLDEDGNLVSGAAVTSEDFSIAAQAYNGAGQLEVDLPATESSGTFHISKAGFLEAILHRQGVLGETTESVVLLALPEPIVVDTQKGGGFTQRHGASVDLQGGVLVDKDGNEATGPAQLFINTIDISDEIERQAFPGNFQGLANADTQPGTLFSLGVTAIDFYQNGEKLQLKQGEVALLRLPIYAEVNIDGNPIEVGDLIPMWTLNERTGVWEEEAQGEVVAEPASPTGLALQAATTHFSYFNADVWGSSLGLSGPAGGGGSRGQTQWCRVNATVAGLAIDQPYLLRFTQLISRGPVTSRTRSSKYDGVIEFSVLQGRPAGIYLQDTETGQSVERTFTCSSNTMELEIPIDDTARFTTWYVINKPVFEITGPGAGYEITKNTITIGGGFAGDKDETAEVTSTLGYEFNIMRGAYRNLDYLASDPESVSFAAYIGNDLGQTDRVDVLEYIDSAAPIVHRESAFRSNGNAIFMWDSEGADTVDIVYMGTEPGQAFNIPLETDINADLGIFDKSADQLLGDGYFELRFHNRYGTTSVTVRYIDREICMLDNPCAA